ncbi:hypothetical protein ACQVP2_08365 [Methylobacterium aquaticum]|uniref:hypothetical protein n=1 Tax=Methylobacterium aquaticum TaxID=270351 RepID=UPI003D17520A
MTAIVTLILFAKPLNDPEFRLTVEVGMPDCIDGLHEKWRCPWSLRPLYPHRLADARGVDAVHSLSMAVSTLQD